MSGVPAAPASPKTGRWTKWAAVAVAAVAAITVAFLWLSRPPHPQVTGIVQLTNDGRGNGAPLLTDGPRLLFNLASSDPRQLPSKGGEPVPFHLPMQDVVLEDISPDRTEFLMDRELLEEGPRSRFELWVLPVLGGSPRRLGNLLATEMGWLSSGAGSPPPRRGGRLNRFQSAVAWSPDGQQLVYAQGNELHLARSDGAELRKLATVDGFPFFVRWSPEGRRIRLSISKDGDTTATLWEVSVDDGRARQLLPGWDPSWFEKLRIPFVYKRFQNKLIAYWQYLKDELHTKKYGIKTFRVVTLTLTKHRARNLCAAAREVLPAEALKYFLFAQIDGLSLANPTPILSEMFVCPRDSADAEVCHRLVPQG
jgi:WD40 repeat protein